MHLSDCVWYIQMSTEEGTDIAEATDPLPQGPAFKQQKLKVHVYYTCIRDIHLACI